MGKEFANAFAIARHTFEEADDLLGEAISRIIFEGPEDLLTQTKNSQLGIFITSVAILRVIQQQFPEKTPSVCAGLSLGEYSALFASGRLGFKDTLFLIRKRALLMNEACEKIPGTMAAVLGLEACEIESALQGCPEIWIANYNCPGQTVISGTIAGVGAATQILKNKGAKRVIPLVVHGAFHSGLMDLAQKGLAKEIELSPIQDSSIGFVMNVPGKAVTAIDEIRHYLTAQVTSSIRWQQGIESMQGIDLFLEVGCGKTLTGFNKKIGVHAPTYSIERLENLEQIGGLCSC